MKVVDVNHFTDCRTTFLKWVPECIALFEHFDIESVCITVTRQDLEDGEGSSEFSYKRREGL